jgi:UDP-glucose 4-epimerase
MKAIVTGGAGFIGSHLAQVLKDAGHEVKIIDIKPDPRLDVRDLDALKREFAGFDAVFHLAALPSVPYSIEHPEETHETNLTGTLNVLLAARDAGVRRVIFSSSAAVYGDQEILPIKEASDKKPISPYALQKLESEEYLRLFSRIYGLETVSLRYFNVYGPGQDPSGPYASAIPKFIKMRQEGKPLTIMGDGEQTRDFVHVSDIAAANLAAATSERVGQGESINIATGKSVSIHEIAELIGGPVEHQPPRLEIKDSLADISLAEELLGWKPERGLEEGIRALL